jgi:Fe-S cluster assembly protein SufD
MIPASSPSDSPEPSTAPAGLLEATLEAARARQAENDLPFVRDLRAAARAFLETRGFPGPKDEAFRLTPLRAVLREPYRLVPSTPSAGGAPDTVLMLDGEPRLGQSTSAGLQIEALSAVLRAAPARVEPWLGKIVPPSQGFVAQNAALFRDAAVVIVREGVRAGALQVRYETTAGPGPALSVPRVLVLLEPGSELTLVETHRGATTPHLESAVTEIVLGRGARLSHVRVVEGARESAVISSVGVALGRESRYASHVFTFGGALSRLDLGVRLEGEGAECELNGLFVARSGDKVDHHTQVDHAVPRCTSRQRYKGILDGDGLSVFDGTVFVRKGASGTVAHQESRNLLLSNDAVAHAKPHLEIDTDDVKCSHGATVGRLDPAQLFYLRSRGLSADVARALLTLSFGREVIAGVTEPGLRAEIDRTFSALLPGGLAAREVT